MCDELQLAAYEVFECAHQYADPWEMSMLSE